MAGLTLALRATGSGLTNHMSNVRLDPMHAHAHSSHFLGAHVSVSNLFNLGGHLVSAAVYVLLRNK